MMVDDPRCVRCGEPGVVCVNYLWACSEHAGDVLHDALLAEADRVGCPVDVVEDLARGLLDDLEAQVRFDDDA